jgi:hypothetical protein
VILEGLTIRNASRAGVVVNRCRHITIRNCVLTGNRKWGVQTCLSKHVTVEYCETSGATVQHGIYFSTTDHPVARGCRIHHNVGCGIHFNGDESEGGDGMITGGLVEDNLIYENGRLGGAAVNMDGVENTVVRNNLIFNNQAGGIVSFHVDGARSGAGNQFCGNTVYFAPGAGRYALSINETAGGAVVRSNVLVCGRGPALVVDRTSAGGLAGDRNLFFLHGGGAPCRLGNAALELAAWQAATGQDRNSVVADPSFASPLHGDFRLSPDSPALRLGAGCRLDAGAEVERD